MNMKDNGWNEEEWSQEVEDTVLTRLGFMLLLIVAFALIG